MSVTTIGTALKEAREKKTLTLDEVHAKIKIHPHVLQLMEEGKFDKLPTPLFAKSFLRSYAEFLGLNTAEVIDAYEKEGAARRQPEQVLFIKTVEERKEEVFAYRNIALIAAASSALVVGGFVLMFAARQVPVWTQKMKLPDTKSWFSRKVSAPSAGTSPISKDKAVSVGKKNTRKALKKEEKKTGEWVRSVEQANFPKISQKTPIELRLRALDNVWVRVTSDGKVVYQGILGRNTVDQWAARDQIELWTGNASSMFLSVNRVSLGSPGRGMIRKMIISRTGVRIPSAENR